MSWRPVSCVQLLNGSSGMEDSLQMLEVISAMRKSHVEPFCALRSRHRTKKLSEPENGACDSCANKISLPLKTPPLHTLSVEIIGFEGPRNRVMMK